MAIPQSWFNSRQITRHCSRNARAFEKSRSLPARLARLVSDTCGAIYLSTEKTVVSLLDGAPMHATADVELDVAGRARLAKDLLQMEHRVDGA